MATSVVNFQKKTREGEEKYITLTGIRHAEVSEKWKVEVLQSKDKLDQTVYAVRLTSTLNGETITYLKEEFEDRANAKKIEKRLNKFGVCRTSYLTTIAYSVNSALYEEPLKIQKVNDIENILLDKIIAGVAPENYYKKIKNFINRYPELFPPKSSNKYQHNVSLGAILDSGKYKGNYKVAIRSGALEEMLGISSDNEYRRILLALIKMGVLEKKSRFNQLDIESEFSLGSYGDVEVKSKKKKSRLDSRIRMNTRGQEANAFVINLNYKMDI